MRTSDFEAGIDDYLLERMPEGRRKVFEAWLFEHPEALRAVLERETLIAAVKGMPELAAEPASVRPPGWAARLAGALIPRPWVAAAGAAAILAVVAFGLLPRSGRENPEFTFSGDQTVRGPSLVLVGPAGDVPSAPEALEWRALSGATEYLVSLSDGGEMWSLTTKETRAALPADIRARLVPGRTYTWRVKAYTPQGVLASASPPTAFRIAG